MKLLKKIFAFGLASVMVGVVIRGPNEGAVPNEEGIRPEEEELEEEQGEQPHTHIDPKCEPVTDVFPGAVTVKDAFRPPQLVTFYVLILVLRDIREMSCIDLGLDKSKAVSQMRIEMVGVPVIRAYSDSQTGKELYFYATDHHLHGPAPDLPKLQQRLQEQLHLPAANVEKLMAKLQDEHYIAVGNEAPNDITVDNEGLVEAEFLRPRRVARVARMTPHPPSSTPQASVTGHHVELIPWGGAATKAIPTLSSENLSNESSVDPSSPLPARLLMPFSYEDLVKLAMGRVDHHMGTFWT